MINYPMSAIDLRLLLPEILWLEPEYFEQAKAISHPLSDEPHQWQAYLNALALLAFEAWLQERLPNHTVHQATSEVTTEVSYLNVGEFKLGLMATEHVLDEVVSIPSVVMRQPEAIAHFYVVLEVLEDQEQVIIRGFMQHDQLVAYKPSISSPAPQSEFFSVPLAALDAEINHLVFYVQHSEPHAFPLPTISTQPITELFQTDFRPIRTRLNQWLQGVLNEGWQTIDQLVNPDANLAWSTRQPSLGTKGGKLINFGVQLDNQTVALLVTVTPEREGKIGISMQVVPVSGAQILPAQLKLTLLSSTNKILQEVQSRERDNYIQLKPFKGSPGVNFSIEVSLDDTKIKEVFEL